MSITMEFARQDDCLVKMIPSDLRQLVGERDALYKRNAELEKMLSEGALLLSETTEALIAQQKRAVPEGLLQIEMHMDEKSVVRRIQKELIETSNAPEIERHALDLWLKLRAIIDNKGETK